MPQLEDYEIAFANMNYSFKAANLSSCGVHYGGRGRWSKCDVGLPCLQFRALVRAEASEQVRPESTAHKGQVVREFRQGEKKLQLRLI